jgi:hypothetical protein
MGGHHDDHHAPAAAAAGEVSKKLARLGRARVRTRTRKPNSYRERLFSVVGNERLPSRFPARALTPTFSSQPTPYISDPTQASTTRCKRRWNDLVLLRADAMAPKTYTGADARFANQVRLAFCARLDQPAARTRHRSMRACAAHCFCVASACRAISALASQLLVCSRNLPPPLQSDMFKLVRERYLLFVQCLESKPGAEPKQPYLYPQPAVAAATLH